MSGLVVKLQLGPMATAGVKARSATVFAAAVAVMLAAAMAPASMAREAEPEAPAQTAPEPLILLEDDQLASQSIFGEQETLVELGGQAGDQAEISSRQAASTRVTPPDPFADPAQSTMAGMPRPAESTAAGPDTELAAGTDPAPVVVPVAPPAVDVADSTAEAGKDPDGESRLAAGSEAEPEAPATLAETPAETRQPAVAELPAPAAVPGPAPLLPPSRPAWAELDDAQRQVLQAFEHEWQSWPASEKRRWLALANRLPKMGPADQARALTRIGEWAALTPEQRRIVLHNNRLASKLSPDERRAFLERYNEMSAEQRQALRARQDWTGNTAARHAGMSTGLAPEAAQPFVSGRARDGVPR